MKRVGLIGGAVGLVAAGAAVGLAAERYAIGRIRTGTDPVADEPFGALPADRARLEMAADGTALYVEEVGATDAPLTVVLVHGYALTMASWHYQRRALAGPDRRLVCYDQRSHGRSARGPAAGATVEQLGRDLGTVLDGLSGPVVVVGHSLGGMTILGLAHERPELFGDQVVGVALLSTSAGMVAGLKPRLPAALGALRRPLIPVVARGMVRTPALLERGRRAGADVAWLLTRHYSFGGAVSPALVSFAEAMIAATPVEVIGQFLPVIMRHDKRAALPALRRVPTLVLVGGQDLVTPPRHSQAIAAALPDAELVEIPGAGHLALLEAPEPTNAALERFLESIVESTT